MSFYVMCVKGKGKDLVLRSPSCERVKVTMGQFCSAVYNLLVSES